MNRVMSSTAKLKKQKILAVTGRIRLRMREQEISLDDVRFKLRDLDPIPFGCSPDTFADVHSEKILPNLHLIEQLAEILNTSQEYLLSGKGPRDALLSEFPPEDDHDRFGLSELHPDLRMNAWTIVNRVIERFKSGKQLDDVSDAWEPISRGVVALVHQPSHSPLFLVPTDELAKFRVPQLMLQVLSLLPVASRIDIADPRLKELVKTLPEAGHAQEDDSTSGQQDNFVPARIRVLAVASDSVWECYFCGAVDPKEGRKEHLEKHADSLAALPDGVTLDYPSGQAVVSLSVTVAPSDSEDGWESSADALHWAEEHGQALLEHTLSSIAAGVPDGLIVR